LFEWRKSKWWRRFRVVWVSLGILFMTYLVLSFSDWGVDDALLEDDASVTVVETDSSISFLPANPRSSGLLFIPGGLVEPRAYVPLLRSLAEAGHETVLVKLPALRGRHAPGEDGRRRTVLRTAELIRSRPGLHWVIAGHSLGGAIAGMIADAGIAPVAGLALLGTTHPRDFSLADFSGPVVKVYGTRDGIAPYSKMQDNASKLPASTLWVEIEGGNHSQFGYYGFQLRDQRATISREHQQAEIRTTLLDLLSSIEQAQDRPATGA
jgi:pimeloyl-ACP methyl ester carboxylesterase